MFKLALTGAAVLAIMASAAGLALADDREPTAEERARIEAVLRDAGYTGWEEIELDDGLWEVDDARHSDGREYELRLDPNTFQIISKDD